jgi:hypothetical protein
LSQRVEEVHDRPGEEARVVRGADRLVRVAEAREVHRDHAEAAAEGGERGQEGALGPAQAVHGEHGRPVARLHGRDPEPPRCDGPEPQPPVVVRAAGGRQEPDAKVQVAAHREPSRLERGHAAAEVLGDRRPGPVVGEERRVRPARRCLEPRGTAGEHRVDRAVPRDPETDARDRARRREHVRVVAVDEQLNGLRWKGRHRFERGPVRGRTPVSRARPP